MKLWPISVGFFAGAIFFQLATALHWFGAWVPPAAIAIILACIAIGYTLE